MTKKVLLAGVLGAVAMFLWNLIAHMALPLGEAGIRQIDHEEALLEAMRSAIPEHGLYMFPNMPPGMTQAQYQERTANGPSGLMVYFPRRQFSFSRSLVIEFLSELAQTLIAAWLLAQAGARTFGGRVRIYAIVGLAAVIATNVSYANWYGFGLTYTAAYMFTIWMGYVCAGLVAAWMKLGSEKSAAVTA